MSNIKELCTNFKLETGISCVKNWFEYNYKDCDFEEYDNHLEVRTNTILFLIVDRDEDTYDRWMLRITTRSAFDRWANSTPIEMFFKNEVELCYYLQERQLDIYKTLLEYLSEEYDELN